MHVIEKKKPERLVLDSVSELAMLVDNPYQLRKQILRIKRKVTEVGATSLFITGEGAHENIGELQTLVHGIIRLSQNSPSYGPPRRHRAAHRSTRFPRLDRPPRPRGGRRSSR